MGVGVNYFVALKKHLGPCGVGEGPRGEGEMVDNYTSINLHVQSITSLI